MTRVCIVIAKIANSLDLLIMVSIESEYFMQKVEPVTTKVESSNDDDKEDKESIELDEQRSNERMAWKEKEHQIKKWDKEEWLAAIKTAFVEMTDFTANLYGQVAHELGVKIGVYTQWVPFLDAWIELGVPWSKKWLDNGLRN